MPILKAVNSKAGFRRAVNYVERKAIVHDAINCRPESAEMEMNITREYFNKTDGRSFYHYVLSFSPDSVISPEKCAEVTKAVVKANPLLKGHEILICVHNDRDHVHSHVIVNAVRQTDGMKLHINKKEYNSWIKEQQRVCKEFGYEPVLKKEKIGEFRSDQRNKYETVRRLGKNSDLVVVYQKIGEAKRMACDWNEFESLLKKNDILLEHSQTRKHVVFGYKGHRFRDSNISKSFSDRIDKERLEDEFRRNRQRRKELGNEQRESDIGREIECRERSIGDLIQICVASELDRKERTRRRERSVERG